MTKIIVDSTMELCENLKSQVDIVPLTVHFGEEEFIDGVTITHNEFYQKLVELDVHPTTSQATPDSFSKVFDSIIEKGEEAVVITISSKLSGTCQSALIACQGYENIHIVDSGSVTVGGEILVELALKLANEGESAKEIKNAGGIDFNKPFLLGYTGLSSELLVKFIEDSKELFGENKIRYTSVGSVIGTHAGPGGVIVAFYKKK